MAINQERASPWYNEPYPTPLFLSKEQKLENGN
jgi:hypothetical protein